ncbi:hypothetical protein ACFXPJ_00440 [Streptomyces goshikiensis]
MLAYGGGELGVEVDAVLGLEDLGADGQQAGAGLGLVQDGGQLSPNADFVTSSTNSEVANWGPRRVADLITQMRSHLDGQPYPGTLAI